MLQRSGRVFEAMTRTAINEGDLAIECPACPHPGRNLPDDWMSRIDSCVISFSFRILFNWRIRWLFTLFIMLDANFRLKLKQRLIQNDICLGDGLSYYVMGAPYKKHLKSVFEEKEVCLFLIVNCATQFLHR